MPKRGDNIRKRKDGRWEGRYKKVVHQTDASSMVRCTGKPTKKQKRSWLLLLNTHCSRLLQKAGKDIR